ncbi:O-antigen ligase family protein [Sphingorhabdus buctiana]|uniref:O-antigen ligase family protein n=2 Tax=Sphingorhabdus buctiana TaxID=1508805 RepID=A0ABW4MAJ1_9SPHN
MPGRNEVIAIDSLIGLEPLWRPLTLTPMNGWHAIASLFAPFAVLLLGVQLSRDDLFRLLPVLIGLGALSGLFGLLQAISGGNPVLYFYRITNNGSAVGLFANRNHAAALLACLFPMLAAFTAITFGSVDRQRSRQILAAAIGIVLIPLILVTGSRSGLLLAVIGLMGAAMLYRQPLTGRPVRRSAMQWKFTAAPLLAGVTIVCLGLLSLYFSRAEAVERLFLHSAGDDGRAQFWLIAVDLFWKYFPVGSGSGSFVEAFQIAEPNRQLDSTYLNRAHNDWLETAVTFGVPGILLLVVALVAYVKKGYFAWFCADPLRRATVMARMASLAIIILAIASAFDYPLRTPTMMCIFVLLTLWLAESGRLHSRVEDISGVER